MSEELTGENILSKANAKRWYDGLEIIEIEASDIRLSEDVHLYAGSIRLNGALRKVRDNKAKLAPVAVRKVSHEKYELIAGISRFTIAKIMDIKTISAVIMDFDHEEFIEHFNIKSDSTSAHKKHKRSNIINIQDIKISKQFKDSTPDPNKIKRFKEMYIKNGRFDKPILILKQSMELRNGYARYLAAKELGIDEVFVWFI